MPKKLEHKLKQGAEKIGLKPGSDAYNRYVYGPLSKIEKVKKDGKRKK